MTMLSKAMLLLLLSSVVSSRRTTPPPKENFFQQNKINLIHKDDSRVHTKTLGGDKFISNMKPILVGDKLKFLDEHNYKKAVKAGRRLKRKQTFKDMVNRKVVNDKCFGGKNKFSSRTDKQNAFRESACLPIMLVPGMMGTRLKVILDCAKLDKSVNQQCEDSCKDYQGKKDDQHRFITLTLWMSLLTGAARILKPLDNFCFGLLLSLDTSNIVQQPSDLPGVSGVQSMFNDLGNSKTGQCGLQSIQDYNGEEFFDALELLSDDLVGYQSMANNIVHTMGYETGINLYPMPYDWRQAPGSSQLDTTIKRALEWSYAVNGKKMLVIAHSLGGTNSHVVIGRMSQEYKDKYIERLVTLGTPYNGSPLTNVLLMGVKNPWHLGFWKFGIGIKDCRQTVSWPSFYALIQTVPDSDCEYYKDIQTRLEMEELYKQSLRGGSVSEARKKVLDNYMARSKEPSDTRTLNYVPFIWEEQFKGSKIDELGLRIRDQSSLPVVTTKSKTYTATPKDCKQILYDQSLRKERTEDSKVTVSRVDRMADTFMHQDDVRNFHPGVPLTVLYSAQIETLDAFITDSQSDPIDVTGTSDDFYEKGTDVHGRGDGTVNTFGAMVRPLKWAHQFANRDSPQELNCPSSKMPNSRQKYPVQMIEYGFAGQLYDVDQVYKAENKRNSHLGIAGQAKTHAQLIGDKSIITLVQRMAESGQEGIGNLQKVKPLEEVFSEPEVVLRQSQVLCPYLYAPWELTSSDQLHSFLTQHQKTPYLLQPRENAFLNTPL